MSDLKGPIVARNKYPGKCRICGKHVPAGEGLAVRKGPRWYVAHTHCDPTSYDLMLNRKAHHENPKRDNWGT